MLILADKYVFIEEARELANNLRKMSVHHIVPSAQIFKHALAEDIESFDALLRQEVELDEEMAKLAVDADGLAAANQECEGEILDYSACPQFLPWAEWTNCAGCGEGASRARSRSGCLVNGENVALQVCENDSMMNSEERTGCVETPPECKNDGDQYNNNNAVLLELMKQQAEQARIRYSLL